MFAHTTSQTIQTLSPASPFSSPHPTPTRPSSFQIQLISHFGPWQKELVDQDEKGGVGGRRAGQAIEAPVP